MKTLIPLIISLALFSFSMFGQEARTNAAVKIRANQAKEHIGADAVVTGKIAEVNKAPRLIRLNFDKPFPAEPFTAVIFAANTNLFPDIDKLKNQTVEVSGKITAYRERPQIVLTSTNQLRVLDKTSEPGSPH